MVERLCVRRVHSLTKKNKTTTPITTPITITTIIIVIITVTIYGTVKIACCVRRMRECDYSAAPEKHPKKTDTHKKHKKPKKQTNTYASPINSCYLLKLQQVFQTHTTPPHVLFEKTIMFIEIAEVKVAHQQK